MLHLLAPSGSRRLLLACLLVAVAVLPAIVEAASYGNCGANGTSFYCPNCGSIEVDDCLGCDGFLNAGEHLFEDGLLAEVMLLIKRFAYIRMYASTKFFCSFYSLPSIELLVLAPPFRTL